MQHLIEKENQQSVFQKRTSASFFQVLSNTSALSWEKFNATVYAKV